MATIYLDNASTTQPDARVLDAMAPYSAEQFGNAAATHAHGRTAAQAVEQARAGIARALSALPEEIVFCSGGTEANNFAILGTAWAAPPGKRHLVVSPIEHASILAPCAWLEQQGWHVTRLPVDSEGFVDPDDVRRALRPETVLVSVGQANNEIGTLQPIDAIAAVCAERCVPLHTDACQSFTRVAPVGADLVAVNGHKIHGPKGIGALRIRSGLRLEPLLRGGGQESGLRAGTLNTPGIVGLGCAAGLATADEALKIGKLRDDLAESILAGIDGARLNGPRVNRLCTNLNVCLSGCSGRRLVAALSRLGVSVSRGSACASGATQPSHVLTAIGLTAEDADSSLRLTLSKWTTADDIVTATSILRDAVRALRSLP